MRFSTVFCVLAAGAVAFAAAVPNTADNQNGSNNNGSGNTNDSGTTEAPAVFNNLKSEATTPLSDLSGCTTDDCSGQAITNLIAVLGNCGTVFAPVPNGNADSGDATAFIDFFTVSLCQFPRSDTPNPRPFVATRERVPVAQGRLCQLH
jgi:hypothetical protein